MTGAGGGPAVCVLGHGIARGAGCFSKTEPGFAQREVQD
ncbi:MAG: hypothetical protein LBG65_06320 [Puniceicoccales bacterium]|nr:hypothetical protein [Puniceicoccales bacterium]